jgi:hypothetical protein
VSFITWAKYSYNLLVQPPTQIAGAAPLSEQLEPFFAYLRKNMRRLITHTIHLENSNMLVNLQKLLAF